MHISSCDELKMEFMDKYFEITDGGLMKTFLGMEIEQSGKKMKMHLDCYIQQVLEEYKVYIEKTLCPKEVQISPGVIFKLKPEDLPELPDQRKLEYDRSFESKLQFAATWVRIDIVFTVSQLARFCA